MTQAFTAILSMSKTASFVILAVILTRFLLRKAPKIISYLLWSVVLIRLLCPVSFSSPVYGLPEQTYTPVISVERQEVHSNAENVLPDPPSPAESTSVHSLTVLSGVWAMGVGIMLLYTILSYGRLKQKLAVSMRLRDNIYMVDDLKTPFVMGLLRPKIYLPSTLEKRELVYILAHEQYHIRRLDYLVKPIGFLALCLHWFNPLVWVAFLLFCKDMEMSCDEAAIRQLGEEIRAEYSSSLLSLATGRPMLFRVPLAFGEGDTKSRIRNLKNWKKPVLWTVILAGAVCAILAIILLTNRTQSPESSPSQSTTVLKSGEQITPEQAVNTLIESILYEDNKIRFTIPNEYDTPEDWVIHISGRAEYPDGMTMRLHYLEETVWEAGKEYSFDLNHEAGVQLDLDMYLTLKEVERTVDLSAYLPRNDYIPLTEQSANACMVQILEAFVLQEDGTVSSSC